MNQSPRYNRDDVLDAALADLESVAESVLGKRSKGRGRQWRWEGRNSAFGTVTMNSTNGRWSNKSTGESGDVFSLWALGMNTDAKRDFPAVLSSLGNFLGVQPVEGAHDESARMQQRADVQRRTQERELQAAREQAEADALDVENLALIQAGAVPIDNTPAAVYLRSRAIDPNVIPQDFCSFIPANSVPKYREGMVASNAAALVIWARDTSGAVVGCQRILIDGEGRKAPVIGEDGKPIPKPTTGRADGVFVRLPARGHDALDGALVIGEGPETALAIWQSSGAETWCVFGVSGFGRLGDMLPRDRAVILAPDNDAQGSPAAKAFCKAADGLVDQGFKFHIAETPRGTPVKGDLQDTLQDKGAGAVLAVLRDAARGDAPFIEAPAPNSERDTVTGDMGDFIAGWIAKAARGEGGPSVHDGQIGPKKNPQNALVRGMQGGGKSTRARKALLSSPHGIGAMLFPTLEKARNEYTAYCAEKSPLDVPALLYRARDAERADGGEGKMCERHKEAAVMARNALDPGLLCNGCPFFDGCPYRNQSLRLVRGRGTDTPLRIFGAHEVAFENSPVTPDFTIVDEHPGRCIEKKTQFGADDFTTNQLPLKADTNAEDVQAVLSLVGAALGDFSTAPAVLRPDRDSIEATRKTILHSPDFEPSPTDTASSIERKIGELRLDYAKGRKVAGALAAIIADIDAGFTALQSVTCGGKGWVATRIKGPRVGGPILALDGTASPILTRAWLGDFEDKVSRVERDATVIQVVGKTYATQSLTGEGIDRRAIRPAEAERLRGEIVDLASNFTRAGVVAAKAVETMLADTLPDTVETAHFNALRGLNRMERCETLIVLGRVQPRAAEVSRIAGAYGAKLGQAVTFSDQYEKTPRRLRMRDSSTQRMEVEAHPDPLGDIVLRQIRDAEIEQAADRCRPIFNRRTIVLMSPVVADFTVDQVVTHAELMAGGSKLQRAFMASGGALRLSAPGLAADASEIFTTALSAKEWIRKQDFKAIIADYLNGVFSQIDILFGKRHHLISEPICSVRVRLKGQRGKPTPALLQCHPDLIAERAVKAWGEIAEGGLKLVAVNGKPPAEYSTMLEKEISPPCPASGEPAQSSLRKDGSNVIAFDGIRAAATLGGRVHTEAGEPIAGRWIAINGAALLSSGASEQAVIEAACAEGRCDAAAIWTSLQKHQFRRAAQ